MGFFSKLFSKGTIVVSDEWVHNENGKTTGRHYGVVGESNKKITKCRLFTSKSSDKYSNTSIEKCNFSNDFGDKVLSKSTFLSGCIFRQFTKRIKRVKGGGKYRV